MQIVVSLCDLTGNFVRPWAEAGFDCYCVDIQHSIRRDRIEQFGAGRIHYVWGDIRTWTPGGPDESTYRRDMLAAGRAHLLR